MSLLAGDLIAEKRFFRASTSFLASGGASYILNSISAYRSAQDTQAEVALDIFFGKPLVGPAGEERALAAEAGPVKAEHLGRADAVDEQREAEGPEACPCRRGAAPSRGGG